MNSQRFIPSWDRTSRILAILSCLWLFGCQVLQTSESQIALSRAPSLVNGEVTELSSRSGLLLRIFDGQKRYRCSASMIESRSRRVILTAAHCVWKAEGEVREIEVYRNNPGEMGGATQLVGKIIHSEYHKGYTSKNQNRLDPYDIALGYLDRELPKDMEPVQLPKRNWWPVAEALRTKESESYHLMGAGFEKLEFELDKSEGRVRSAEIQGEYYIRRGYILTKLLDWVYQKSLQEGDSLEIKHQMEKGPYVCPGDSGGAMIARKNAVDTIVGVFSTEQIFVYQGRKACWYPVYLVPVSPHLQWIQDMKTKLEAKPGD